MTYLSNVPLGEAGVSKRSSQASFPFNGSATKSFAISRAVTVPLMPRTAKFLISLEEVK